MEAALVGGLHLLLGKLVKSDGIGILGRMTYAKQAFSGDKSLFSGWHGSAAEQQIDNG